MDHLLELLEELQGYHIDDSHNILKLAFADDLILLADNREKAHNEQVPGLSQLPPSREQANDQEHAVDSTISPQCPIGNGTTPSDDEIVNEQQW